MTLHEGIARLLAAHLAIIRPLGDGLAADVDSYAGILMALHLRSTVAGGALVQVVGEAAVPEPALEGVPQSL